MVGSVLLFRWEGIQGKGSSHGLGFLDACCGHWTALGYLASSEKIKRNFHIGLGLVRASVAERPLNNSGRSTHLALFRIFTFATQSLEYLLILLGMYIEGFDGAF